MNRAEFTTILQKIAHYYPRFYAESDPNTVFEDWFEFFENNSFNAVMHAVKAHVSTSKFAPTIADLKAQMVESYLQNKPTSIQAFQVISDAVRKTYDRADAVKQYNALPPILKKLVGKPEQLRDWSNIDDSTFQTVIMSAIRESYTELAKREAKFYAFPAELQRAEIWRIADPGPAELPAPEITKTVDEIIEEANAGAAAHGMVMTDDLKKKNAARVDAFLKPVTKAEEKALEFRDQQRLERKFR